MAETQAQWLPPAAPMPPPPPAAHAPTSNERTHGMLAHLSALSGLIVPFGNLLGPLIVWLLVKDKSPFADHHGKQALNFQIGVTIVAFLLVAIGSLSLVLAILILPMFLAIAAFLAFGVVYLGAIVLAIVAALEANKGTWYRYPMTMEFVK